MHQRTKFIIIRTISNILLIGGALLLTFSFGPVVWDEAVYQWRRLFEIEYSLDEGVRDESPFALLRSQPTPIRVEPVSRDFGIVIEKIGVNAPVVSDVSVIDEEAYREALKSGVAHAKGTIKPGEVGNCYIFAHSSLNFWQLGKYATVFNLLRKLEPGDRVVIFYRGQRFDYYVMNKEKVPGFNTYPLTRNFSAPYLTLQTCDPPGTTINRLVITAKLGR